MIDCRKRGESAALSAGHRACSAESKFTETLQKNIFTSQINCILTLFNMVRNFPCEHQHQNDVLMSQTADSY